MRFDYRHHVFDPRTVYVVVITNANAVVNVVVAVGESVAVLGVVVAEVYAVVAAVAVNAVVGFVGDVLADERMLQIYIPDIYAPMKEVQKQH